MVLVSSTMLPLGTKAPDFSLYDAVSGKLMPLESFADKVALLVMFICCHCPYVKHIDKELAKLGEDYKDRNLAIVAISSNDAESYPDDSPEMLSEMANRLNFSFPILFDETQAVAHAYTASCTPDFFLFDSDRRLVYRGQLDDSRPGNGREVTGRDLRTALEAVLAGGQVPSEQVPSIGCNIKWKPGNEPDYFGKR
jgi:peroxiredoxin